MSVHHLERIHTVVSISTHCFQDRKINGGRHFYHKTSKLFEACKGLLFALSARRILNDPIHPKKSKETNKKKKVKLHRRKRQK